MDQSFTLFTRREKIYKTGVLRKLYNIFVAPPAYLSQELVYPEELFCDIICKLWDTKLCKKYNTESITTEDAFGMYPWAVFSNSYVARENIYKFFKLTTNINGWLSGPQLKTLEWLESLVLHQLFAATHSQILQERSFEISSIFRYIRRPIKSYSQWNDINHFFKMQSIDVARGIYEKLSDKLGENEYFFQKEGQPQSKQISSLDLVVYCHLKQQIVNIPDSAFVKMLNADYKNLINFVKRIDGLLASDEGIANLRIDPVKLEKIPSQWDTIVRGFLQPTEYTSNMSNSQRYEDISEDTLRRQNMKRIFVVLMAASVMVYFKYAVKN